MPNHFHLILRQKAERGISIFLQRLSVSFSMYFNLKYDHSGTIFQGRFQSRHIDSDPYFKWIFSYVHLNPVALAEPQWEERGIADPGRVAESLRQYLYSSYRDYYVETRPERAILAHAEGVHYVDAERDVLGLLEDYVHGRMLFALDVEKRAARQGTVVESAA